MKDLKSYNYFVFYSIILKLYKLGLWQLHDSNHKGKMYPPLSIWKNSYFLGSTGPFDYW